MEVPMLARLIARIRTRVRRWAEPPPDMELKTYQDWLRDEERTRRQGGWR